MPHVFRMQNDANWYRHAEIYGLRDYQQIPRGSRTMLDALADGPTPQIRIDKTTRIVALGSCFAMSVAVWLREHGYTLLEWQRPAPRVGTMYHTDTLRQECERAAEGNQSPHECFRVPTAEGVELVDPYRAGLAWDDEDEMRTEPDKYQAEFRSLLERCDVLIFTAGQTEAWRRGDSARSFSTPPPPSAYDSQTDAPYRLGHWDDLRNLETAWGILRTLNPKAQMIVTVSPVLLQWTTRNANVIVAAMQAKAQLRAAVGDFVQRHPNGVEYFPSFEAALLCIDKPYRPDHRHVTPAAVAAIMTLFERMYVRDGA